MPAWSSACAASGLYEQLCPEFLLLLPLSQLCIYQIFFRSCAFGPLTGTYLLIERSPVSLADKIFSSHCAGQVKLFCLVTALGITLSCGAAAQNYYL